MPQRDRSGDTLFIGEPICGLWQRGRTRRVSAKMVTIDTGDTLDPGTARKEDRRRTPRANNTPELRQYSRPRNNWLPRAMEQRAMKISRAFLPLPGVKAILHSSLAMIVSNKSSGIRGKLHRQYFQRNN